MALCVQKSHSLKNYLLNWPTVFNTLRKLMPFDQHIVMMNIYIYIYIDLFRSMLLSDCKSTLFCNSSKRVVFESLNAIKCRSNVSFNKNIFDNSKFIVIH